MAKFTATTEKHHYQAISAARFRVDRWVKTIVGHEPIGIRSFRQFGE